jgi:hypothetical protein
LLAQRTDLALLVSCQRYGGADFSLLESVLHTLLILRLGSLMRRGSLHVNGIGSRRAAAPGSLIYNQQVSRNISE